MERHPYELVTETVGTRVTREGADMIYTRYRFAADLAAGKRVLELACGSGQGLGLISTRSNLLVGGDIDSSLLSKGQSHYRGRIPLLQLNAEALPFRDDSFDMVLCYEASYYLPDVDRVLNEVSRILSPQGILLFVNANPERPDFIRSPYSVHYHSADEFRELLGRRGFSVDVHAAFPISERGTVGRAVAWVRKTLERLGLVPSTLRARALLKRLAYGRLVRLPPELPEGFADIAPLSTVEGRVPDFKVIYVVAKYRNNGG